MKKLRGLCRFALTIVCIGITLSLLSGLCYAEGKSKKPYKIDIYTYRVGTFTYAMGVAWADFINKDSSWVRGTAMESPGPVVLERLLIKDPSMRKNVLGYVKRWESETAYTPFKKKHDRIRDIAAIGFAFNGFITLNPNIKSLKDLSGKRVGLGASPSPGRVDLPKAVILESGAKGVKFSEHGFVDGVRALGDGVIDALLVAVLLKDSGKMIFAANPALSQVLTTKKVNFLSFDEKPFNACLKRLNKIAKSVYFLQQIPAGSLPQQNAPWGAQGSPVNWGCDVEMPEDVVYEITKIMAENAASFQKYHPLGKIVTPNNMALTGEEEKVHLGALKFYKENGIKVGRFGK